MSKEEAEFLAASMADFVTEGAELTGSLFTWRFIPGFYCSCLTPSFNMVQAFIARRSNMLVMSADGPISAYVNAEGYVQETLTLSRAWGLMLRGRPDTTNSWFPGYALLFPGFRERIFIF